MSYIRAVYFWVFMFFWTIFMFTLIMVHKGLHTMARGKRFDNLCHNHASRWSRVIMGCIPIWKIEITGKENLPADGEGVVVAANHESMADIWALFCVGFQFRWLSKIEVFKVPLVGRAMHWAGYIPIKRGDKSSHTEALKRSADALKAGTPMVFFPEGTRSEDGTMRPFKLGAFKLAEETNVPILPIVLKGAGDLMRKGSGIPFPATVKIKILPRTRMQEGEGYESYAARVRQVILAEHKNL